MPPKDQKYGLILSKETQGEKNEVQNPKQSVLSEYIDGRVPPLFFESDVKDLLRQIRDGAQHFLDIHSDNDAVEKSVASFCTAAASGLLPDDQDEEPPWERLANSLILISFLYGTLASPDSKEYKKILSMMGQQQAGPHHVEEERERGRQWMREQAVKLWEEDGDQQLRIGEAVTKVKGLVNTEISKRKSEGDDSPRKYWGTSFSAINKAIHPVAPDYATRKGRPKKK